MTHTAPHAPAQPAPWRLEWGALPLPDGSVRFRVWAPRLERLSVQVQGRARPVALQRLPDGVFQATVPGVAPGTDYAYVPEDGRQLPDPASRWQPAGVHGPSRVVAPDAFAWHDGQWRGLPLEALVVYELHVGTFTPQGTFAAVAEHLEHLCALGVTAVEVMPVAAFPGERNWGYDGAHLYAPQHSYGGPEGLKALVDACHRAGLAVILDVVYNHLGPEGNHLGTFGPYFTDRYHTPWGDAVNYDGADCGGVRRHIIENALYWLSEYHVDGLRLDAVHGIFDFGAHHVLEELSDAFHRQAARLGRQAWLIAESDLNDTRVIAPPAVGGWGLDAQWSDDFHHALHTALVGTERGYFADFGRLDDLCKALQAGFVYDGRYSRYRRRRHGNVPAGRPARQFMVCTQNHDQIANACGGRRLSTLAGVPALKLAAAVLCCAPGLPLLFMGQEYGEPAPFAYFTSHEDPALAEAVTEGRRREYAAFDDPAAGNGFADPQDEATFLRSRLDWALPEREPHAGLLRYHQRLLALRREHPCLGEPDFARTRARADEQRGWLVLERWHPDGQAAVLLCNFRAAPNRIPVPCQGEAWQLALWSGAADFGEPAPPERPPERLAFPRGEPGEVTLAGFNAALYLRSTLP